MNLKQNLVAAIQAWRLRDGKNGRPAGWLRWAKGMNMVHTTIFRFCKNDGENGSTLGAESLHKLAAAAAANGDNTTIMALAEYALGVKIRLPVDN